MRYSFRTHTTVIAILGGVLLAGCGGTSGSATVAAVGTTSSARTVTTGTSTTGTRPATRVAGSGPLAFAECMRANGVPSFPDPSPVRGSLFSLAGVDTSAPAFKAAQAKCQKLLGSGLPFPGSTTHPSAQTLAKLLRIARCMRAHDVPQFPDPQTSVPSHPTGIQEITDFDGAILLIPATINLQAPAYRQALTACGAPPLGLRH